MTDIPEDIHSASNAVIEKNFGADYFNPQLWEDVAIAILAERERDRWMPIETAPTDGAFVFLYWPTMSITAYPAVGFSHGDEYGWELVHDRDYGEVIPTHWRELFHPPSKASPQPPIRGEQQ